jgi:filamentous hemagglutinin family protein
MWKLALAGSGSLCLAGASVAQIATDGTVGPASNLAGPNFAITPGLGRQVGRNLFHSFSTFSIKPGETATFSGPANVRNVMSRVTGGTPTNISGTLRCSISNANMYLVNPAGVMFGPGASLDVSGSFVASTAEIVHLKDGGRFSAANPTDTILTSANPAAFGFLTARPKQIVVNGDLDTDAPTVLEGAPRKSIALIGGDIRLSRAEIQAPSGRVHLISVGSSGEVRGDPASPKQSQEPAGFATLGNIQMTDETLVTSNSASAVDPPGRISIKGQSLRMNGESAIAVTSADADAVGPGIDVDVRGRIELADISGMATVVVGAGRGGDIGVAAGEVVSSNVDLADDFSGISALTFDAGAGGLVRIRADLVDVGPSSIIGTVANGAGDAGNVDIRADTVFVRGESALIGSRPVSPSALGRAGSVRVRARSMQVRDGGGIVSRAVREGLSGDLTIVADRLLVDGDGAFITAEGTPGPGRTGLTISGTTLTFSNGASVDATSDTGEVGQLTINATELSVRSATIAATSIQSGGGTISIASRNMTLEGSDEIPGLITATNVGPGQGGAIRIDTERLVLRNNGGIVSGTGRFDLTQFDQTGGPGSSIRIFTNELTLFGGSVISAQTVASAGPAGSIQIQAQRIELSDTAAIVAPSFALPNDPRGGRGGDVVINTDVLQFNGGGDVVVSTNSSGDAGNVRIRARHIDMVGRGPSGVMGILSTSSINQARLDPLQVLTDPYGSGGTIDIRAASLSLSRNARITSESLTTARAGNVLIAADDLSLRSGAIIATSGGDFADGGGISITATRALNLESSAITAQAANNILFAKDGGNVVIRAGKQVYLRNSTLTAEAGNNGGNIDIDPDFVILSNSTIIANAVLGDGGDINIAPDQVFLQSTGSTIESRSVRGQPGTISITQVETDVSGALLPFTNTLVDAARQLKETCQRRLTERFSSFIVQGRGGVMPDPTNPMQSQTAEPDR